MKATAKNFTTLPASQIPSKLKDIHNDLKGIAQFYGQDKDITETIDSYVAKLNAQAGKAKRNVKPAMKTVTIKFPKNYKPTQAFRVLNTLAGDGQGAVYVQFEGREKYGNGTNGRTQWPIYRYSNDGSRQWVAGAYDRAASNVSFNNEVEGYKDVEYVKAVDGARKRAVSAKRKKAPAKTSAQKAAAKKKVEELKDAGVKGKFANLSRGQILAIAQKFNASRTLSAQIVDGGVDHKKRLAPTPENLVRWMKNPGKFDLIGVDNFKKNDATANLKISKQIFWNRLGFRK